MSQGNSPQGEPLFAGVPPPLMKEISYLNPTIDIGSLPQFNYVHKVHVHVIEAFDGGTTLTVGHSSDADAYVTALAVSTTGVKTPTLGAGIGYDSSGRTAQAAVSGIPTVGKALIIVEFFRAPRVN